MEQFRRLGGHHRPVDANELNIPHRRNGDVWDGYEHDERADEANAVDEASFTRRATTAALTAIGVVIGVASAVGYVVHWMVGWP